jgi:uncharacterized membrane protein YeiH
MNRTQTVLLAIGIVGLLCLFANAGTVLSPELVLIVSIPIVALGIVVAVFGGIVKLIKEI